MFERRSSHSGSPNYSNAYHKELLRTRISYELDENTFYEELSNESYFLRIYKEFAEKDNPYPYSYCDFDEVNISLKFLVIARILPA